MNLRAFGETFVTLFVITDPIGNAPIFVAITRKLTPKQRQAAALRAVLAAGGLIIGFAVFGEVILRYLHVSLGSLSIAGGLLLMLVALELLTGHESEPTAAAETNVALVPLGTPLLAGPGAIVAMMLFTQDVDDLASFVAVAAGVVLVHVALWLSMRFSLPILRVLRESGVMLITRIAGLLLSAIAVQMVADAVRAFVAGEA
jgi:multiple antibiotic resistance protein